MENGREKGKNDRNENNLSCRWIYKNKMVGYLRTVSSIG
jgi:hypothetical protein